MGAYESDYSVTSFYTEKPDEFILYSNNPNPFNPQTTISYSLQRASFVQLKIFNNTGQEIDKLVNDFRNAGYNSVIWDADKYANGLYFYQLLADGLVLTKKMLLLK